MFITDIYPIYLGIPKPNTDLTPFVVIIGQAISTLYPKHLWYNPDDTTDFKRMRISKA